MQKKTKHKTHSSKLDKAEIQRVIRAKIREENTKNNFEQRTQIFAKQEK
jgi:hypothetical protein